jgi:uncharacterized RDD family membrane protein YckC
MNVWLIEDGERHGPFPAFEIENRIRAGELGGEQPAWTDGEARWRKLGEMPAFAAVFRELVEREEKAWEQWEGGSAPLPAPPAGAPPPPLPPQALGFGHWSRRFWARWFDLHLFGLLWWGGMRWAGRDLVAALTNPWLVLAQLAPWFLIEAFLLHRFGTTPGKYLLGLRVRSENGQPIPLGACLIRCFRVWGVGLGFGLPMLVELCQIVALWVGRRTGRAWWDFTSHLRVTTDAIPVARIIAFAALFFVILQLRVQILMPAVPALLELYGQDFPPWLREMMTPK